MNHIESLTARLNELENTNLIGGWGEHLKECIVEEDNNIFLKGFKLLTSTGTRLKKQKSFNEIRGN